MYPVKAQSGSVPATAAIKPSLLATPCERERVPRAGVFGANWAEPEQPLTVKQERTLTLFGGECANGADSVAISLSKRMAGAEFESATDGKTALKLSFPTWDSLLAPVIASSA